MFFEKAVQKMPASDKSSFVGGGVQVNEELRMKNEEIGGIAATTPAGVPESFMTRHRAIGNTCESRGLQGNAEATPFLHS